ncbi:MAG: ABC transporter substrate-binding protein [Actinomycetaceae bacterium]|nr:ABC transporter substrate-binding protein [Actinomycetaceae bacterium]
MKTRLRAVGAVAAAMVMLAACGGGTSSEAESSAPEQTSADTRIVVDSRGVEVEVPTEIKTVATVSDAFVEEIMYALDVDAEVTGLSGTCIVKEFSYDFVALDGEPFEYTGGMNPANYLMPEMRDMPIFAQDGQFNFETLATIDPDVLIIHSGCCTVNWAEGDSGMEETLNKLDGLGIPTVVVHGPNYTGQPNLEDMRAGIEVVGDVFGKKDEASDIATLIEDEINEVVARTADIPEDEKTTVLIFGLNPNVRSEGNSGIAMGVQDVQSYMLTDFVNATNVFTTDITSSPLNAEQVLASDPDAIILPTHNGYHPPRELLDTDYFTNLSSMRAIQEERVAALPWSPCNCDQRLEMPVNVMVMAKTAYPELFEDIDLEQWMLDYFMELYGVDEETADGIISALWMDWARTQ